MRHAGLLNMGCVEKLRSFWPCIHLVLRLSPVGQISSVHCIPLIILTSSKLCDLTKELLYQIKTMEINPNWYPQIVCFHKLYTHIFDTMLHVHDSSLLVVGSKQVDYVPV